MSINISIVIGVILNNRDLHFASGGTHNLYKVDNEKMVKFRTTLELLSERLIKYDGFDPNIVYHVFVFNKENYKKTIQHFDIEQDSNIDEIFDEFNSDDLNPNYFITII